MNTPIKREDIRKGDVIRYENPYGASNGTRAIEWTADEDGEPSSYERATALFLIERPVQLPTEHGVYLPYFYAAGDGIPNVWILNRHGWTELPNMPGRNTESLDIAAVKKQLGTLVYLGTGSIEQQVSA